MKIWCLWPNRQGLDLTATTKLVAFISVPFGVGERKAFEIEDRRPVVRAASLHPEPDVKTAIESTVSLEPISFDIAEVLTRRLAALAALTTGVADSWTK